MPIYNPGLVSLSIIVMGAIIKGRTDHCEYVCSEVSFDWQNVAIEQLIQIIFGVLTCRNKQLTFDRINGNHCNIPQEMVNTAIQMINLIRSLEC